MRRRPSKRSLQAKIRRNLFIIIVVFLLLGWGLTAAWTWPGFRAQHIVVSGTARVDPNLVRSAAHISLAENIWLINPWQLAARVGAIPYVLSVDLQRELPNKVTLVVHERKPSACVVVREGSVTIDDTERVLENGCRLDFRYVVPSIKTARIGATIDNRDLLRLHTDVDIVREQNIDLASASFDRDDGLVLVTRNGVTLLLGEEATLAQTSALINPIFFVGEKGRAKH